MLGGNTCYGGIKGNWVVAIFRVIRVGLVEGTFEQGLEVIMMTLTAVLKRDYKITVVGSGRQVRLKFVK